MHSCMLLNPNNNNIVQFCGFVRGKVVHYSLFYFIFVNYIISNFRRILQQLRFTIELAIAKFSTFL